MSVAQTATRAPSTKHAPHRTSFLGRIVYIVSRALYATLRVQAHNDAALEDLRQSGQGAIVVVWHGSMLVPIHAFRGRGYWTLLSSSNDGEVLVETLHRLGWRVVRGSTGRGGVRAALQLARNVQQGGILAFTPDGPRGPARKIPAGTIFLAQRSGRPIIPVGSRSAPRVLLRTWDRYLVPLPFARAAYVVGEPIYVPDGLDEAGRERLAEEIGRAIDACEKRAEEMLAPAS